MGSLNQHVSYSLTVRIKVCWFCNNARTSKMEHHKILRNRGSLVPYCAPLLAAMDYVLPAQTMSCRLGATRRQWACYCAFPGKMQAIIQLGCLSVTKEKTLFFPALPNFLPLLSSPTGIVLSYWSLPPRWLSTAWQLNTLWNLPQSPRSHVARSKWLPVEVCKCKSDIPDVFAVLWEYSRPVTWVVNIISSWL
jgi:hypothetical protein